MLRPGLRTAAETGDGPEYNGRSCAPPMTHGSLDYAIRRRIGPHVQSFHAVRAESRVGGWRAGRRINDWRCSAPERWSMAGCHATEG